MIAACTSCKLRFEASSYRDVTCPTCGAIAQQPSLRPCPRCDLPLGARTVGELVIDECSSCQGLFLDAQAIRLVLDDEDHSRAETLLAALPKRTPQLAPGGKMYIRCPACSTVMNRKLFATGSGVIVDVCKSHGTFFDGGELPAIIEFMRRGGLELAAKKDAARAASDARDRAHKAAAERGRALLAQGNYSEDGTALVDLLSAVFD